MPFLQTRAFNQGKIKWLWRQTGSGFGDALSHVDPRRDAGSKIRVMYYCLLKYYYYDIIIYVAL